MARPRRKPKRRKTSGSGGAGWLVTGLALGLAVAAWIWWSDRQDTSPPVTKEAPVARPSPPAEKAKPEAPPPADERFEFYDMLPSFEVVVPETTPRDRPGARPPPIELPGTYVLQAGSFPEFSQADAVKARLALLGVSSQIQKVSVDERTFHRVRIGPVENLTELNRLRDRLRQNQIDFLVIQVRE